MSPKIHHLKYRVLIVIPKTTPTTATPHQSTPIKGRIALQNKSS